MRISRAAALTTAAVGMTIVSIAGAVAAPAAPAFLSASQLPAASTPWHAEPVQKGAPADFCTEGVAPTSNSRYREYQTELDTGAWQTITVAGSESRAKALTAKLRTSVESCFDRLQEQYPSLMGEAFHHGRINVEEGANVYSIDTSDPEIGSSDVALYSIGRDGRAVTVVRWGQLGDLEQASVDGFRKTTRTAVAKLY
jgi:hypothetical protein